MLGGRGLINLKGLLAQATLRPGNGYQFETAITILERYEPLPEIDDPVTLVTLTVAKMVQRWIAG